MARRRWRSAAVIAAFAALILVPPGIRIWNTGDYAWCRPIGEWREPVSLFYRLTTSQNDAVNRYLEETSMGDRATAEELIVRACDDAREDRQTLIIVAAVVVAAVVVRRSTSESAGQLNGTGVTPASLEGGAGD